VENGRQTTWQRTRTQIVAVVLIAYWTALCLGTHLPGGVVVAPPVSDKLLHFAAYAGLSFLLALLAWCLGLRGPRVYAAVLMISVCYGAIDELGQIPVPGRHADMADWNADMLGVVAGLTLHWLAVRAATVWGTAQLETQEKPSPP